MECEANVARADILAQPTDGSMVYSHLVESVSSSHCSMAGAAADTALRKGARVANVRFGSWLCENAAPGVIRVV